MFEKIDHYTQLLFPDGLLNEGAFIRRLTDTSIIEENWWTNVEIIGWFYQYYIANEKDRVIKAKKKYKKDEIPFATQLFTPDWIVRYMVQNSLGRYWLESHPEQRELKEKWEFYLENPNPEADFEEKLAPYINKELKVEDIKCFDPACGSGHILVYMFDVLYEIYEKCGYTSRDIPELIIENNLYGLDIDDRAYQLACFAVVMKGMEYNNRLLRDIERQVEKTGEGIKLNIASIQETNEFNNEDIVYLAGEASGKNYEKAKEFIELFKNAKVFGSLIKVENIDVEFFKGRLKYINVNPAIDTFEQQSRNKFVNSMKLELLVKQIEIMIKTYDTVCTNPPYFTSDYFNIELYDFISKEYNEYKSDIFSAFIKYCLTKTNRNGQLGFMTPYVWMFIPSYNNLREYILNNKNISSFVQLEYSAFEEATVPICTFTMKNYNCNSRGEYIKLSDFRGAENQAIKTIEAINQDVNYRFSVNQNKFKEIEGSPIAFWISDNIRSIYSEGKKLESIGLPKQGLITGDVDKFTRLWHEVDINRIRFNCKDRIEAAESNKKWFPYNKGGEVRRWYGNNEYIVNWENDGYEIKNFKNDNGKLKSRPQNLQHYFKKGLTWTKVTSAEFSIRFSESGFIFSEAGMKIIIEDDYLIEYLGALLNTKVIKVLLGALSETMNNEQGNIARIPILSSENKEIKEKISLLFNNCLEISKKDWDSFETSWEFNNNSLILNKGNDMSIETVFDKWSMLSRCIVLKQKENEENLNKIFIDIYNLNEELIETLDEKDIILFSNGYYSAIVNQ